MSDTQKGALYSPELLSLAVELAGSPYDAAAPLLGEARSRSCGSIIRISSHRDLAGLGLQAQACAVGQGAAAIFLRHAQGRSPQDIADTLVALETWLAGEGTLPDWPDLEKIEMARNFPGRHGAILLPWQAALDALSNSGDER
ncbi:iron-sulfur cluster assembly scaffold protein [Qipengyuania sp. GH1]|uniref:iron-sulfur cluster assembly scaffold protein n=1 Tax=Qipengyuania aestuarii TaxID=2867241 RepID=UPI001C87F749|nr:iron-sulfur cluster assembly scaffold protein [Qipengyuania aestuarii]